MNDFERLFSLSGLSLDRMRSFLMVAEAGNQSKAAKGDTTRQSQFSRQIKELEGYFGIQLTRLVGRRIEITPEGLVLARLIRRYFGELDDFREAMNGRQVSVRMGAQGSVIEWLVVPRISRCRDALGGAIMELEQMRSAEIVRGVADGRLDFGIVRDSALAPGTKHWKLGVIRYALFAEAKLWDGGGTVASVMGSADVAGLLPGGEFDNRLRGWLAAKKISPRVVARLPSFIHLARLVGGGNVAAVLPEIAKVEFEGKRIMEKPIPWKEGRQVTLIANARSLERTGIPEGAAERLAKCIAIQ